MKKFLLLLIAAALCISLFACGTNSLPVKIDDDGTTSTEDKDKNDGMDKEPDIADDKEEKDGDKQGDNEKPQSVIVTDGSKLGALQNLPFCDERAITGAIAVSGSGAHDYGSIEENIPKGYKTEGINCVFGLDEQIELYLVTELVTPSFNVYFVKNDTAADYAAMTAKQIEELSLDDACPIFWGACPDSESFGYIGTARFDSQSFEPGLYDAFFVLDEKVNCMLQFNIV